MYGGDDAQAEFEVHLKKIRAAKKAEKEAAAAIANQAALKDTIVAPKAAAAGDSRSGFSAGGGSG